MNVSWYSVCGKSNEGCSLLRHLVGCMCECPWVHRDEFTFVHICAYVQCKSHVVFRKGEGRLGLYAIAIPSIICLSVTFVHPTQTVEIFGNVSSPFGTLAICWHPRKFLRRSSQGNPSIRGFKRKRGSQI